VVIVANSRDEFDRSGFTFRHGTCLSFLAEATPIRGGSDAARPFKVKDQRVIRLVTRSSIMKSLAKWVGTLAVLVVVSGSALGAEATTSGKVKAINSGKKEFVLTDAADKDWTFKFGDNVLVNRDGKESKTDLNVGDPVNVCYDKGIVTWTAHYILVQEGTNKNCGLVSGTVKAYHDSKKEITFSDGSKDYTLPVGTAKVRLNNEVSKAEDLKIGDHVLAIMETVGDKTTLKSLRVDRK
jgi:hypothetical protein